MAQLLGVHHGGWRPRRALLAPGLAAVVPIAAGLAVWPSLGTDAQAGSLTVAVVQGNAPDVGLALLREGQVLRRNHVAESERLLADVRAGRAPQPDLVVWPETAGVHGEDPRVDQLVDDFGVPALIGALERGPDGHTRNVVIAWEPGTGAGERYVKQQLVPFGEYLPAPSIARLVTPFTDDSDTVVAGSGRPAALTTAGTTVGTFISYEAAYDYPAREAVRAGAQLLVNPTNHAWYGRGEASHQQLAMTRLRAVKHGRAVVVAATSGVSAIIAPDGSLRQATGLFTPASLVARVPLRQEVTVATRLGTWTETALVAIALAASARRRVPGTPNPEEDMR